MLVVSVEIAACKLMHVIAFLHREYSSFVCHFAERDCLNCLALPIVENHSVAINPHRAYRRVCIYIVNTHGLRRARWVGRHKELITKVARRICIGHCDPLTLEASPSQVKQWKNITGKCGFSASIGMWIAARIARLIRFLVVSRVTIVYVSRLFVLLSTVIVATVIVAIISISIIITITVVIAVVVVVSVIVAVIVSTLIVSAALIVPAVVIDNAVLGALMEGVFVEVGIATINRTAVASGH